MVIRSPTHNSNAADPTTTPMGRTTHWQKLLGRLSAPESVALAATAVFLLKIGSASPWRDEVVSVEVARRGPAGILDVVGQVDLVHTLYYSIAWAVTGGEPTVILLRLVSASAFAATALVTYFLGARLGGRPAGLIAAALVIASPLANRYAQEARPYALVSLVAATTTLLLLRLCDPRTTSTRAAALYTASSVVLVLLNILAALLLACHGVYLLLRGGAALRRGALALTATVLIVAPFVVLAFTQRGQVEWLQRPNFSALTSAGATAWGSTFICLTALLVAVGAASLPRVTADQRASLVLLILWGWLAPITLWAVSQVHPLFDLRYIVYCLPGTTLAFAVALVTTARAARGFSRTETERASGNPPRRRFTNGSPAVLVLGCVAVAAVTVTGFDNQLAMRGRNGHSENLRGAAEAIATAGHRGEPILFDPDNFRLVRIAYPRLTAGVDDVALCRSGEDSGSLVGEECDAQTVGQRLRDRARVLVLDRARSAPFPTRQTTGKADLLSALGFVETQTWRIPGNGFRLSEWERRPVGSS